MTKAARFPDDWCDFSCQLLELNVSYLCLLKLSKLVNSAHVGTITVPPYSNGANLNENAFYFLHDAPHVFKLLQDIYTPNSQKII